MASSSALSKSSITLLLVLLTALFGFLILFGLSFSKAMLGKNYMMAYWVGVPLILYVISTGIAIINQYAECSSIQINNVMKTSWQIIPWTLVGLGVGELIMLRAPVVTLFGLFPPGYPVGLIDIKQIETLRPESQSIAAGYWLFWAILFGQMTINGKTAVCKSFD